MAVISDARRNNGLAFADRTLARLKQLATLSRTYFYTIASPWNPAVE